ncbi:MAG TPA: aminotransferase class I/II-fold pyridoxal phosphate-dependent enzyme [Cryptosporangiaceae bacterium]|nr:aminotransferase class I/II-fold pyridoxal phosphate-dependent enzyme [Cryptosporangiaceae bacterium]
MTGPVYLSAPDIGALEESYVVRALRSGWVAPAGPDIDAFERETASRTGVAHAVAVSSGTAALHLALVALGVGTGDAVVVPTMTFAATANAVTYTGAVPVFVDCEPSTGNLDVDLLGQALDGAAGDHPPVRAVIPVDMFGKCVDYSRIAPICAGAGVELVEDAAESLGAAHRGRPAGGFGQIGALSFNGNKILTTSGGGMLLSDDGELAARCRYLATQARQPVPHYEHTEVGYNYRLSNILAALGRAQLHRLDELMARRRHLRELYRELFAEVPGVRVLGGDDDAEDNCWLTSVVVDHDRSGWTAAELAAHLAADAIETRPVWKPMHLQPVFAGAPAVLDGTAERLFRTGLTLPSGSSLTGTQIDRVVGAVERFLRRRPTPLPRRPVPVAGGWGTSWQAGS